MYISFQALALF